MGTITGLTAARMLAIEAAAIVSGVVSGDDLILERFDGQTINAGSVRGIPGPVGPTAGITRVLHKVVSVGSHDFVGLDGNNEGPYRLTLSGKLEHNAGGSDRLVTMIPNPGNTGWFSTLKHGVFQDVGPLPSGPTPGHTVAGGEVPIGAGAGWLLGHTAYLNDVSLTSEAIFDARDLDQNRSMLGSFAISPVGNDTAKYLDHVMGEWEDKTNNVTALRLDFGGGLFTGAIILEKMGVA